MSLSGATPPALEAREAAEWDRLAREAERAGDLLRAYDYAVRGLDEHPGETTLRYRAVLNLSRSGAADRAEALYEKYELATSREERIAALGARLLRERSLAGEARLDDAAGRYAEIYRRTQGTFPGINAASLYVFAGKLNEARTLAREVFDACTKGRIETYDRAADATAAALIINELAAAREFIELCKTLSGDHYVWMASTRRQLAKICDTLGLGRALLGPLRAKMVIHYTGHMIARPGEAGRFPAEAAAQVATEIARYIKTHDIGFGSGSLACGADILVAEALLNANAELNVVLPFAAAEFREHSVARGGDSWAERFDHCLERAASVSYATEDQYLGDRVLFGYSGRLAIGLALLRAQHLDAPVTQLAVSDGAGGSEEAGAAADIAAWQLLGLPHHIIDSRPTAAGPRQASANPTGGSARPKRAIKAMLFGDAKGFSKLPEAATPAFVDHFLGTVKTVLARYEGRIEFRNTWGDGLYLVMRDARSAMECALDLQAAIAKLDRAAVGLPPDLGLRIAGHAGPVFPVNDPILDRPNFMGSHVNRTARMEPITPEGEVYVTEAFAALIALERDPRLTCEYVGIVPTEKGYGSFRMYVLKRRQGAVVGAARSGHPGAVGVQSIAS